MKRVVFLLLMVSVSAQAYVCPSYVRNNESAQKAHEWLTRYKGEVALHGCELQITVCDKGEAVNDGAPVGEVLILTESGREAYLSIDFPVEEGSLLQGKVKLGERFFHYEKKDRYPEEVEGRTEVWRFEMRTLWGDPSVLDVVELGIYSTNSQLGQSNGNDSKWYVCKP